MGKFGFEVLFSYIEKLFKALLNVVASGDIKPYTRSSLVCKSLAGFLLIRNSDELRAETAFIFLYFWITGKSSYLQDFTTSLLPTITKATSFCWFLFLVNYWDGTINILSVLLSGS